MKLRATAPMRIDLAGGTLDIYPLYLFEEGGLTLNAAITLTSEVWVETHTGKNVRIVSEDLDEEIKADDAASLDVAGKLDLLARVTRFYAPADTGLAIHTRNNVPKGSGLGASSSLLITLSHALNHLRNFPYDPGRIIDIGACLEAQTIRIPTGKQDYFSATYGGVSTIWFDVDGARREPLIESEDAICALEDRLVISFAGEPRFSGLSNWNMTRAYIDGEEQTVRNIGRIKQTALDMRGALESGDWEAFGRLLGEEWENRKVLAEGVTNEQIDGLMATAAEAGAISSKICGAGGGGCMISFCEPGAKETVSQSIADAGGRVLDCRISRSGVTVEEVENFA